MVIFGNKIKKIWKNIKFIKDLDQFPNQDDDFIQLIKHDIQKADLYISKAFLAKKELLTNIHIFKVLRIIYFVILTFFLIYPLFLLIKLGFFFCKYFCKYFFFFLDNIIYYLFRRVKFILILYMNLRYFCPDFLWKIEYFFRFTFTIANLRWHLIIILRKWDLKAAIWLSKKIERLPFWRIKVLITWKKIKNIYYFFVELIHLIHYYFFTKMGRIEYMHNLQGRWGGRWHYFIFILNMIYLDWFKYAIKKSFYNIKINWSHYKLMFSVNIPWLKSNFKNFHKLYWKARLYYIYARVKQIFIINILMDIYSFFIILQWKPKYIYFRYFKYLLIFFFKKIK